MFDGMSFDELNKLHSEEHKNISIPYEQYFGEMALTEAQIERRIETAKSLEDAFLFILSLAFYMVQANAMNYAAIYEDATTQYQNAIAENNVENSPFFSEYHVPATVADIVDTTFQNPERTFNYSYDRAMLIAENEANAIWNDAEFEEAVQGGKTHKKWLSIIDNRTRDSHRYLDGKTKPILEPFEVGESLMMYPKDESLGAGMEEIANCRCSAEYYLAMPTGGKETGGHYYDSDEFASERDVTAANEYRKISREYDADKISRSSGFAEEEIIQIKRHLFFEKHRLYDGYGYLAPDYDIAVAWKRLREGRPEDRDILLLKHERLESNLEKEYDLSISEAHEEAKKIYDWEKALLDDVGEGGEPDGLL